MAICDQERAADALSYKALVQSWPEIERIAAFARIVPGPGQTSFEE